MALILPDVTARVIRTLYGSLAVRTKPSRFELHRALLGVAVEFDGAEAGERGYLKIEREVEPSNHPVTASPRHECRRQAIEVLLLLEAPLSCHNPRSR